MTATGVVATHGDGLNGNATAAVRKRTRRRKKRPQVNATPQPASTDDGDGDDDADTLSISVEYVPAVVPELADPAFRDFQRVFARFGGGGADDAKETDAAAGDAADAADADGAEDEADADADEADGDGDSDDEGGKGMSNKAKRLAARLTVAQLKQLVKKPEVVDWVDCTAADPKLLVHLKSYRNTVPVPIHWQQKRKYLQGKRGIEKPPFDLPDFIKQTGIMEIRSAVKEKEDASRLKSKARERIQPKMGKLDLDYQKLHDAFFRWQTKPQLSRHGDMYFEGKEFETKLKMNKPGQLSDDLKAALGMPALTPPPWLINMQRYGPPPSYPGLKIPGLNAPIPEGSHWGFHPGGWGKPPVDEYGRPLYGDVFGVAAPEASKEIMADVERTPWGELEPEEEEEYDGY
ncbi:Splicing factor 3B subunit 2, partial [Cladochytrium tenue]